LSVTSAEFTCSVSGQNVDCDLATLDDEDTATITISTLVDEDADDASTVSNTVDVSSDTDDPDEDNNSATEETGVDKLVDLQVEKKTSKTTAVAGETHPYEVIVYNDGPSSATNVVITDTIPAGTTLNTTLSDSSCSAVGTTVTCLISSIAAEDDVSVNIIINIPADFTDGGNIVNSASAVSDEDDSDDTNDSDSVTTPVDNSADLSIVKDANGSATAGEPYSWDLNLSNDGSSDAVNVVVTDTLPAGMTFNAVTSDTRCSAVGQLVTCTIAVFAANTTDSIIIGVDVSASVIAASNLTNTADIDSDTDDPNTDNNESSDTATVARDSDLDIAKSDISDPVTAGGQVQWKIRVDNRGPSDAANVTITDNLPTGFTFVSLDNPACSHSAGTVSCLFASIADDGFQEVIITANIDSSIANASVIENSATANSDSSDPVTDIESTTVVRSSDLSLTKSSDEEVIAGTNHTYSFTVTNNGPSDADNVEVTDYLPGGVTFVSSTNPGCAAIGATVVCDLGTIADEGVVNFDIVVYVADAAGESIKNIAEVDSDSPDPDETNNTDDDETDVSFEADLNLEKEILTDPIVPGESITWKLTVTNIGPSIANNVVVTDTLPAGLTFVAGGSSSGCSAVGQLVTCSEADMIKAEVVVFEIEADIDSDMLGSVSNDASVDSDTDDPDETNNDSSVTGDLEPSADLSITKASTSDEVIAGDKISYNLTAVNDGSSDAVNVVITDPVPANTTFVPTDSSSNCSLVGTNVVCTLPNLPADQEAIVVVTFELGSDYEDSSTLLNQVVVDSDTEDPDPDNNGGSDTTPVITEADLSMVKSGPSDPVQAGENFVYKITLTNEGLSDAQAVVVTDTLPTGTTFVSVDDSNCSHSLGTVTCSYPTVVDQDEIEINITVAADSDLVEGSTISNSASVTSDTDDPDPDNNEDDNDSVVERTSDLLLTKSAAPQPVTAGTNLVYTLTVINNGPAISDNVEITDNLPAGTSFVSADTGCSESLGVVTCLAGSLDVDDSASFDVTVFVETDVLDMASLENDATASGDDSPDSEASEETEVETSADLSLVKVLNDELIAGEPASYTLTLTNLGPSDAQNVVVADALPAGLTYVSDTGGCTAVGGLITCDLGTVADATSVSFDINVMVESWVDQDFVLTNNASSSSDTADPDPENNSTSDTDDVDTFADLSIEKVLDGESLPAGQTATYLITVTNDGPSDAQNVIVSDALPTGLTFVPAGSSTECIGATTVTCTLSVLGAGISHTFTIVVDVDSSLEGSVGNPASVVSETADPDLENNETVDESPVSRNAEIVVDKVLVDGNLTPGTEAEWIVSIDNLGPASATDVSITDVLPAGLEYVSHSIETSSSSSGGPISSSSGSDPEIYSSDPCSYSAGSLSCLFDVVEVGDHIEIIITTFVNPEAGADEIVNTASVSSPEMSEPATAQAAEVIDLIDAELDVSKVGPSEAVNVGDEFDWIITVLNDGDVDVTTPLTITDDLPEGLELVSVDAVASGDNPEPVCVIESGEVSCEVETLATGDSATVTVRTKALESKLFENTAQVEGLFLASSEPVTSVASVNAKVESNIGSLPLTGSELKRLLLISSLLIGFGTLIVSRRRKTSSGLN